MALKELKSEAQNMWRQAKDNYTEKIFDLMEDNYGKKGASGTAPQKKDGILISKTPREKQTY